MDDQVLNIAVRTSEAAPLGALKRKALSGVVLLGLRKLGLHLVSFAGGVFLARLLSPEDFGIYAIVSFIISFLTTFSGVGFGASLIQKKKAPTESDLRTIFTLQQAIVFLLVLGVLIVAPYLTEFYHLSEGTVWLIRIMSVSLILSSLKVIPSVLLQRRMDFGRFVVPEIVETIAFNVLAVVLAWWGFGVWSLVGAALVRGVSGVLISYILCPWKIGLGFNRVAAVELLRFGIPYEMTGWVGLIMNSITPFFLGPVFGATAVGYINWAKTMAGYPAQFIYVITAVLFPVYARLQDHPEELRKAIEKTVLLLSSFILPIVFIAAAAWPQIVHYVFTDKWLPAVPAFYLFCVNVALSGIGTVLSQALYASGRADTMLKLMVLWMVLMWGFSVPLSLWLGPIGVAVADMLVAVLTLPLPIYLVRRHIGPVKVLANYIPPFIAALCAGGVTWILAMYFDSSAGLILALAIGGGVYLLAGAVLMGAGFWRDLKDVMKILQGKRAHGLKAQEGSHDREAINLY